MAQAPYAASLNQSRGVGFAVTSLVLGIAAFLLGWVAYLGILLGAAAIVFAILALARKQSGGMAITGLVLGTVATIFCLIVTILITAGSIASSPDTERSIEQSPATESVPQDPDTAPSADDATEAETDADALATSFGDGTHSVGSDIEAGTYRNDQAGFLCYYFWKDGTGADAETLDMGHVEEGGAATITVENGQAFKTNQCGTWLKQ